MIGLRDTEYVYLDTETHLIAPYSGAPRIVCMQIMRAGVPTIYGRDHIYTQAAQLLGEAARGSISLVGQTIDFDLAVLASFDPRLIPMIFDALDADAILDTQLIEKLLCRADGTMSRDLVTSLAGLSRRYLDRDLDKGEDTYRMRYGELESIAVESWPDAAIQYAKLDVEVLCPILAAQIKRAQDLNHRMPGVLKTQYHETRLACATRLMSCWGLCTDSEAIDALEDSVRVELDAAEELLWREGLLRSTEAKYTLNTKALRELAVKRGAYIDVRHGRDYVREVSTKAWVLRRTGDPTLCAVAARRHLQDKALGLYVPLLRRGVEQPIHSGVDTLLETGRISTYGPNIQNLPQQTGYRECIVPRKGRVFCAIDFDGAELRSLAQMLYLAFGSSVMADTFRRNKNADLHLALACESILEISLEEGEARKRAKDQQVLDTRQNAKAANFGYMGGMRARAFCARQNEDFYNDRGGRLFSVEQANTLRDQYLNQWPRMRDHLNQVERLPGIREGVARRQTPVVGGWRGGLGYTQAANSDPQSLTAHGAKKSLYAITRACYDARQHSALYGARPVVFAHDEVIIEVDADKASEAAREMERIMISEFGSCHPDIPVTASAALMDRWCKSAEPCYDNAGNLSIWRPT